MKRIELHDILPLKPEFTLAKSGKVYQLRPTDISDVVWLRDTFGGDEAVQKIMNDRDWPKLCRIIYRQMTQEGRADFLAQEVDIVDEDGVKVSKRLSGPEVLFYQLSGSMECLKMLGALNRAILMANPLMEEEMVNQVKKSLENINRLASLTGPTSSTN